MKSKLLVLMMVAMIACPFKSFAAGVVTPTYDTELQAVTLNVETDRMNSKAVVVITQKSDDAIDIDDTFYSITEISRNSEGKFAYTAFLPENANSGVYDVAVTIGTETLICSFTHINSNSAEQAVTLINNSTAAEFSTIIETYYTDLAVDIDEFNLYKEKLTEIFYKYKDSNLTVDTFYDIYHKSLTLSKMYGADRDVVISILNTDYAVIEFDAEKFELLEMERKEEIYSRFSEGIYTENTLSEQYSVWEALSGVNVAQKKSIYDYETTLFVTYGEVFNLDKTKYDASNQKNKIISMMMEKTYDSVEELLNEFESACDKYPYKEEKVEVGPSGGGGGGSYIASGKDKNKTENEKESVEEKNENIVFSDVNEAHWAYEMIMSLCNKNIVSGDGNGNFLPDKSVTRGEFSKMIALAFYKDHNSDSEFADVNKNDWYYPYISALSDKGIVTGVGNNMFYPQKNITRQDMAVIIKRVADDKKINFSEKNYKFSDEADIAAYAKDAVSKLASEGVIGGMGDGTFKPYEPMTRAQAAKVIFELAELLK